MSSKEGSIAQTRREYLVARWPKCVEVIRGAGMPRWA